MAEMRVIVEDGAGNQLDISPTGGVLTTALPSTRDSVGVGGTSAAPAAGTAVVTLASGSLPAGYYRIEVHIGMSGTLGAADGTNMELRAGSTVIARLAAAGLGASGVNDTVGPFTFHRVLDGSTALTVNATGAATAGSVYHATVIATQVN